MKAWTRYLWLLGLLALLFDGKGIYMAFYALCAVYFGAARMVSHAVTKLEIVRNGERSRIFPGERVTWHVRCTNPTRFPIPWLLAEEHVAKPISEGEGYRFGFSLPGKATMTWDYSVVGRRRGVFPVGPLQIQAGDPFGLGSVTAQAAATEHLIVYPQVRPLAHFGLRSYVLLGDIDGRRVDSEDTTRVRSIRDYVVGDPYNRIHWKAYAHTGTLQVKEFELTRSVDLTILLDLNQAHYHLQSVSFLSELAIETVASVCFEAVQRRQSVSVISNGRDVLAKEKSELCETGLTTGDAHLMWCLEFLARQELADSSLTIDEIWLQKRMAIPRRNLIMVVTPRLNSRVFQALADMRATGYRPYLISIGPQSGTVNIPPGIGYASVELPREITRVGA